LVSKAGFAVVKVTFLPLNQSIEFDLQRLPYKDHGRPRSLLDVALNFGIPLQHVCGGNCACTTCHVLVKKGQECLSRMAEGEEDRLDLTADLTLQSRLGCQAVIEREGEIVVEIPARNRNYGGGSEEWFEVSGREQ
jgi:2Fe-2S ferredoxin